MGCPIAGGKIAMHDKTRDEIASWANSHCNMNVLKEQWVPKWSTDTERAKLDISVLDPTLGQIYVDVTVVDSITGSEEKPMQGLEAAERKKHDKYRGGGLFVFAIDVRGRWGKEADKFVKLMTKDLSSKERLDANLDLRRRVATTIQCGGAEQIITGARPATKMHRQSYRCMGPTKRW